MINVDDRLLEACDEKETYLLLTIAAKMNRDRAAWPSLAFLTERTGWSKNTVIRIRKRLEKKRLMTTTLRPMASGNNATNVYRVNTPYIGIYVTLDDLESGEELEAKGGSAMVAPPSAKTEPGAQKLTPGGSAKFAPPSAKFAPEVLTIAGVPACTAREPENSFLDSEEIDDLDRQCAADALQKSSAKKGAAGPTPVVRRLEHARPLGKTEAMDMLEIYFDGERGQSTWERIRTGVGADPGELVEPYLSVQAMIETIDNPEVWSVIGAAVKALPGFAAIQLMKERTARRREELELARIEHQAHQHAQHANSRSRPGAARSARSTNPVISDQTAVSVAEEYLQEHLAATGEGGS